MLNRLVLARLQLFQFLLRFIKFTLTLADFVSIAFLFGFAQVVPTFGNFFLLFGDFFLVIDPRAVLMATVIGSSCAYATPIGMPANMMVLSAGGYKFVDYAKSGIPLIIVSTIVSLILLPILFPFHP